MEIVFLDVGKMPNVEPTLFATWERENAHQNLYIVLLQRDRGAQKGRGVMKESANPGVLLIRTVLKDGTVMA